MSIDKFIIIHKLLTDHKLEFKNEVPETLKCIHCESVLKVACQVPCGCKMCHFCIENLISNGNEMCPRKSADCKEASLSEYVVDYQANKIILKLIVKCPEENCRHECELLEVENHLQNCPMKKIKCIFHEFGCEQKVILSEINEHFLLENYSHFSKLIEIIYNIKNELAGLKHESALKDKTIQFLSDEIASIKNENKSIKNEIYSIKLPMVDDDHPPGELGSLETDLMEIFPEKSISTRSRKESTKSVEDSNELRQWRDRVDRDLAELSRAHSTRLSAVEQSAARQLHAYHVWVLDILQSGQWVWSEYFRGATQPYRHRVGLCHNHATTQIYVTLYVHAGPHDAELVWPFRGSVGITINDRSRSKTSKTIWRSCELAKPPANSYECTERFVFDYSDWTGAGVRLDSGLVVTCVIVPLSVGQ